MLVLQFAVGHSHKKINKNKSFINAFFREIALLIYRQPAYASSKKHLEPYIVI